MARRLTVVATIAATLVLSPSASGQTASSGSFVPVQVASPTENEVVVEPGDHLWKISASHLEEVLNHPPDSAEVAPYWVDVIDSNRDSLRSGDPDLIYPGEVVKLPEPVSG